MVGLLSSFTYQETLKVQCVGFSAIMNNGGRCVATSSNIVLLLFFSLQLMLMSVLNCLFESLSQILRYVLSLNLQTGNIGE